MNSYHAGSSVGSAQPGLISGKTSLDQIASLLVQHGVTNVTSKLDFNCRSSEPFASGGFGSIYRGELQGGQRVAMKQIKISNQEDLEPRGKYYKHAAHELYTWSKCDHPGILKALGFALFEGYILLVSPWMQNGSLIDHVVRKSPSNKLKFCIDLAETVEYLHGKGIVHGDIKGDNILISDSREVQLADFGSATLTEYHTLLFTWTSPQFACSVRFTAPEILDESSKKHTIQSDIYALGMTILQILTGQLPYVDDSDMRTLANVFRGIPPPRPRFDCIFGSEYIKDKLWSLLLRCWEHNPNLRPTAMQIKQALVEIKQEIATSA